MYFFSVRWPDLSYHSCGRIVDYCSQDCLIKQAAAVLFFKSNSNKPSSCALFSFDPPTDLIFSCGVCVERATHPLHNNDGFCLHLPVFLLSASPAELQLFQCQPWHQWGALPHWHGEDDQVQDLPGLPALLPSHLQLHPLPGTPGQPRRAHFQGTSLCIDHNANLLSALYR